jgi:hypothetical protein
MYQAEGIPLLSAFLQADKVNYIPTLIFDQRFQNYGS